jgi:cation diffusion facilitator family transporter
LKNEKKITFQTAILSALTNAFMAVGKGVAGIFGNSDALIADAIESTSDVLSSILVIFGISYAQKPADEDHPYGHGRAESLSTFAVVGFLIVSATFILNEGIRNLFQKQEMPESFTFYVLIAIVLIKELSFQYVYKKGKQTNSSTLMADAWHHRSDAISSVIALIGVGISLFLGPQYVHADDWAAIIASLFIYYNAYKIFRPTLGEIMDEHMHHELIDEIRKIAFEVNGVKATEKCWVRKSGMYYQVDLHIEVDPELSVERGHEISHLAKDLLMERLDAISHVHIHIEPYYPKS